MKEVFLRLDGVDKQQRDNFVEIKRALHDGKLQGDLDLQGLYDLKNAVNVDVHTSIYDGGTLTVQGAGSFATTLNVVGAAAFASTVAITGLTTHSGNIKISGHYISYDGTNAGLYFNSSNKAFTSGAFETGGIITAGGNIYLGSYGIGNNASVLTFAATGTGAATFSGNVYLGSNGLGNNASVLTFATTGTGLATFGGALTTGGIITSGGNIYLGANGIGNNASVLTFAATSTGKATFAGDVDITGTTLSSFGSTLYVDPVNNKVGIRNSAPAYPLSISGNMQFVQIDAATAPTAALAGAGGGSIDNGDHRYEVVFVTSEGFVTSIGAWSNTVTVADKTTNGKINVTNIPVSSNSKVTTKKLYRTKIASLYYPYLLTTLNNADTSYADNTADSALGALGYREENTTAGRIYFGSSLIFASGFYNLSIGYLALSARTTGDSNVAIGPEALKSSTGGSSNTAVGFDALYTATSPDSCVAVGYAALLTAGSPSNTVAVGNNSLRDGSSANYCVAVGGDCLRANTGANNVGMGYEAGRYNATGTNGVVIGYRAGKGVTGNNHSSNVFIGSSAGLLVTTGSNNILIGYQAGDSITSGASNIIIGYDLDLTSDTTSNELKIGGVITGNTSTFAGNIVGDFSVATNKLTVSSTTGLATFAGNIYLGANGIGNNGSALTFSTTGIATLNSTANNNLNIKVPVAGNSKPGIDFWATLTSGADVYNSSRIYSKLTGSGSGGYTEALTIIGYPTGAGTFTDFLCVANNIHGITGGLLGIGTISPEQIIHAVTAANDIQFWIESGAGRVSGFRVDDVNSLTKFISSYRTGYAYSMGFEFGTITKMVLTTGGQLVINDTAATVGTNLDVNGATLFRSKAAFIQTDLNEFVSSDADGYLDLYATTLVRAHDSVAGMTYAASNVTTDRTYDANATTTDELADVLGTLIADLRLRGLIG